MKQIRKRRLIPVITDLLEYNQAANNTIAYAQKMRDTYGDVCDVSFTNVKSYFIHDPEVIKEILTTQGPKMKRTYFYNVFRKFLGNGLLTSDGEEHKQQRRLIKPAFYPQRIEEYAEIMIECARTEVESWRDGETININKAMTRITLNVITNTLFGSGLDDATITGVGKNVGAILHLTNRILQNPFYIYCTTHEIQIPIVKKFFRLKTELDTVIGNIISSYRKEGDVNKKDLLALLLDVKDEETNSGMTDEQIRDEVMTFFLAGHETTSLALTWTLYLLGKNHDVAKEFHDEVRSVFANRSPMASDYETLTTTKNIFKESLRLYPPVWTIARETREDVVIQDYFFPKGSVLWTVTYLLHHNEEYFHDAEKFIPSRWNESTTSQNPKYTYFPFGGGNRMCIGEGFAWMEGVLVLATIASMCELTLPENYKVDVNPVFTLRTKKDVMMKAVKAHSTL